MQYVHSNGEIEARTWISAKKEIPFMQIKKERTGQEENKYEINICNFKINLSKKLSKFENYDTMEVRKKLRLFSDFYLPITLTQKINYQTNITNMTYSLQEAKDLGRKQLEEELKGQIENKQVVDTHYNVQEKEAFVEVELVYEILEKIGTKEKIVF